MIRPPSLKIGDKIAFIAPARKITKQELVIAEEILEDWGLEVFYPEGLFLKSNQFAGSDLERITHIQHCFDDKDIKGIFCVRGGYGTSRIVDNLDFSPLISDPKWIIGFSDVTVLLNQLCNFDLESIHGPIALLLGQNIDVQKSLHSILFDDGFLNRFIYPAHSFNQLGLAKGKIVGGNLSVLVNQIGTASFPAMCGSILFLEDLDEYLYHIDRMMIQLERIGVFNQINGLVIGYMSGMHDNSIRFGGDAYQVISDILKKYKIVVAFGLPIGHEERNMPIVVGRNMSLEVGPLEVRLVDI
tara:strand:- start:91 stop:990 length:900 start_codon:yes stop_codon:yes gene_type:complete